MIKQLVVTLMLTGWFCSLQGQAFFPDNGPLYVDTIVPRIDIIINPDTLDWLYQPDNLESNREFHATFIYNNGTINDTISPVGFRLRGNTSRQAKKKSFKVSFNTFTHGGKYYGVEKLNLNGEHNDPSIMRSKICWDILRKWNIPAPRSNHVRVYINNIYYGLYINVEHIDEEFVKSRFGKNDGNLFKCLWPADLDYLGENPDLYKFESGGRRTYTLKTNKEADDYSDLANYIDVLNNTLNDNFVCNIEDVFNVDDYIKVIAFDILTGNWDGPIYNKNNFYLYNNTSTGKFEYIPYDLDNTIGIDWFGIDWTQRNIYQWSKSGEPRPVYTKIMANPELRAQFTFYMNQLVTKTLNMDSLSLYINNMRSMISPYVINDTYYSQDYGFTYSDFMNSIHQAWGSHVTYGIIPYLSARIASIKLQLESLQMKPVIKYITHQRVTASQIDITAYVEAQNGLATAGIRYYFGDGTPTEVPLFDDGNHNDGIAGDLIYGGSIEAIPADSAVSFQIIASDSLTNEKVIPCIPVLIPAYGSETPVLYINEFMASNSSTIADEQGNYPDWIEIYNGGSQSVWLGNLFLTDNLSYPNKWQMPDMELNAGDFVLIWADGNPNLGSLHTNFKLSKDGEEIGIYTSTGAVIDMLTYGAQTTDVSFGRLPDGGENWQLFHNPTPGTSNKPDGVGEKEAQAAFTVYPNPATSGKVFFSHNINYRVYNTSGMLISEGKNSNMLDVSTFSQGLYIIVSNSGAAVKLMVP